MRSLGDTSIHSDFYRYWQTKRAGRLMPTRADVDPVEIPHLLPYVTLVEPDGEGFYRYRLMGTAVVQQLGRDLTGQRIGHYVKPEAYGAKMRAIYDEVFATGRPLFTTGEYKTAFGTVHATCRLTTPLCGMDGAVMVAMATRVARSAAAATSADWALTASGEVKSWSAVSTIEELRRLSGEWDRAYPVIGF